MDTSTPRASGPWPSRERSAESATIASPPTPSDSVRWRSIEFDRGDKGAWVGFLARIHELTYKRSHNPAFRPIANTTDQKSTLLLPSGKREHGWGRRDVRGR